MWQLHGGIDRRSPPRGPLQVLALDHPNLQAGLYPNVMIPAFAVPTWIILHALSLWQLRRAARRPAGFEVSLAAG
jgi:hypothetical protein